MRRAESGTRRSPPSPVRNSQAITDLSESSEVDLCRTGKDAVYPQFFLQLGEEPPAFVVSTIALCRFHGMH